VKNARIKVALAAAAVATAATVVGAATVATGSDRGDREVLTGYEEVPTLSTPGNGELRLSIPRRTGEVGYELSFRDTESDVTQAHIHFGGAALNGPVVVFLCTNLGNGPAGTPPCPAGGGTVTGTFGAEDVGGGAAEQGLAAGELDELVRAIRAGATYVNVHTVVRTGGEIRAQIETEHGH
jgi:hypothetical protein